MAIFDRSWYGRVLVERVEAYADKNEWSRAYEEINAFESSLVNEQYILIKFWIHLSKDEQLKRFNEREEDPFKKWKITNDDWRNREKWDHYEEAANEMFIKTHDTNAPWFIVPGNDKKLARMIILDRCISHIEKMLIHKGIDIEVK